MGLLDKAMVPFNSRGGGYTAGDRLGLVELLPVRCPFRISSAQSDNAPLSSAANGHVEFSSAHMGVSSTSITANPSRGHARGVSTLSAAFSPIAPRAKKAIGCLGAKVRLPS
ncbi:hypothetical protein GJ744_002622 [Endocarpon pusillum]|uniref:Uncharacterized protein n=1 Tax=Endocarpon pusillum TaxID=364733 RepID=A0A8H7A7U4_9EURO|nr:hypothetical protein GJ744_002622 [Endocarpon pusillum]